MKLDLVEANDEISFNANVSPKAFYSKASNKTYYGYIDTDVANWVYYVKSFDHGLGAWGSAVSIATLDANDAHDHGCLGLLPSGKLITAYDAHGDPVKIKTSNSVEDESAWTAQAGFGTAHSYPQLCSFDDKVVLFTSNDISDDRWEMRTTTDGVSWNGPTVVATLGVAGSFYAQFHRSENCILMSGHRYAGGLFENLYFAYSDDEGSTWKNADGSTITLPIDEDQKVATHAHYTAQTWSYLDGNNRPVVIGTYLPAGADSIILAQYSTGLGSTGSWTQSYAKDTKNTNLAIDCASNGHQYVRLVDGRLPLLTIRNNSTMEWLTREPNRDFQYSPHACDFLAGMEACKVEVVENGESAPDYPYVFEVTSGTTSYIYAMQFRLSREFEKIINALERV